MRRSFLGSRSVIAVLVLGVLVYSLAAGFLSERASLPSLGAAELGLLVAALASEMLAKAIYAGLFVAAVGASGKHVSFSDALRATLVAGGVARLLPAGGAFVPPAMAWTVNQKVPGTAGAALRTTVLTYGALVAGSGAAILWVRPDITPFAKVGVLTIGTGAVVLGLLILAGQRWMAIVVGWLPERLRRHLEPTMVKRHVMPVEAGLLVLRLATESGALYLSLRAFGIHLTFAQALLTYGVAHLVGGFPGTPGGIGLIEAGLVWIVVLFGNPAVAVIGPVLVYRIISYWIPAALGIAAGARAWYVQGQAGTEGAADRR
jgi:uncharacterized membrane protein YbhN (UPF0104 family)